MSNAFAPRPFEEFEDEFDLDMDYAQAGGSPAPDALPAEAGGGEDRPPLRFTTPAPVPAVTAFTAAGELGAGAAAAFSPPVRGGQPAEVSVPRIAIHVFAERQDTLAAAERAGQDRRLARATTHIRAGGGAGPGVT